MINPPGRGNNINLPLSICHRITLGRKKKEQRVQQPTEYHPIKGRITRTVAFFCRNLELIKTLDLRFYFAASAEKMSTTERQLPHSSKLGSSSLIGINLMEITVFFTGSGRDLMMPRLRNLVNNYGWFMFYVNQGYFLSRTDSGVNSWECLVL